MPSRNFSISNGSIIAYISGYIVRKRRSKFCTACQDKFTLRNDASQPSQLFLFLKAYSDAQEGLFAPSIELRQLIPDLECPYRAGYLSILHMNWVRERLISNLLVEKPATVTVECWGHECQPKQLIVNLFVSIKIHHSLKNVTEHCSRNKVRRNWKQMEFIHDW